MKDFDDYDKKASVKEVESKVAESARDHALNRGSGALGCFDSFGRDAARLYNESTPKRGKPNYLSAEFQDCFGHSLIEVLKVPKSDTELTAVVAGLQAFNEELKSREIVSAFAFAPVENLELSTAFLASGYRKTGLRAQGVLCEGKREDAVLWTRKLADPSGATDEDF